MSISPSYIITRLAKSVFTGPVRPTPGTAKVYSATRSPDAEKGFRFEEFMERRFPDQSWPNSNPPIDIEIRNLARTAEAGGVDNYIILVGLNPGSIKDSGSQPRFNSIDVLGRSSPYALYYGGQARSVSVSFKIHRDLFSYCQPMGGRVQSWMESIKYWEAQQEKAKQGGYQLQDSNGQDFIAQQLANLRQANPSEKILEAYKETLNWIRALQYPIYTNGGVVAPKAYMRIGKFLMIEGYPSVNISYESIFSEGYPVVADVDITITETLQRAVDQTAIYNSSNGSAGMNVVEWPNK